MNFTKKLLLSAALIIGFVAAGFAQESKTETFGNFTTTFYSDGTAAITSSQATFIKGKNIAFHFGVYITPTDLTFSVITPEYTGSYTDKVFTAAIILDGDKSTYQTATGLPGYGTLIVIDDLIEKYEVVAFKAAKVIYIKIGKSVFSIDMTGFNDALQAGFKHSDGAGTDDPFGGDSDDPFGGTELTVEQNFIDRAETLNPYDLEGYLAFFVDFARDNGLDFSYIYQYDVELKFTYEHMQPETIAYTTTLGNDKEVYVAVNPDAWVNASPAKRVAVLFHELGHDILNFEHNATEGPLMSVYAQSEYTIEQVFELVTEMFTDYKNGVEYAIED